MGGHSEGGRGRRAAAVDWWGKQCFRLQWRLAISPGLPGLPVAQWAATLRETVADGLEL